MMAKVQIQTFVRTSFQTIQLSEVSIPDNLHRSSLQNHLDKVILFNNQTASFSTVEYCFGGVGGLSSCLKPPLGRIGSWQVANI